jgi:hypothetical protein
LSRKIPAFLRKLLSQLWPENLDWLERTNFLLRYCFPSADSWARDYVDSFVRVVVVVVVVDIADSLVVVDGDAARTRGK